MTDDQIKHMTERFLGWRLPENFQPDAGISFKAEFNDSPAAMEMLGLSEPMRHQPVGTNLFDYTQAEAMIRYMVEGLPALSQPSPASSTAGEVRDPVMRVTASLAAAISILRRAHKEHKEPRKVVASDKMFLQMLADYEAAVEAMRSTLSPSSGEPASATMRDRMIEAQSIAACMYHRDNCTSSPDHPGMCGCGLEQLNRALTLPADHYADAGKMVEPASVAGEAEVRHLAAILEEWDMKDPPNEFTGHAYEDIARDALTRLALSKPTPVEAPE